MKKYIASILVLTIALIGSACSSDNDASSNGDKPDGDAKAIVIGVVADQSNTFSEVSKQELDGMNAAVDQINAAGGVLGRTLELRVENDDNEPTKASAAVRSLVNQGADLLVMASGSQSTVQTKPVIQEMKIPTIAPSNAMGSIADPPDNDYIYLLANPNEDMGTVLVEALKSMGIKNGAAVIGDEATVIESFDAMRSTIEDKAGVTIANVQKASSTDADVTAQISQIVKDKPDGVFVQSLTPQLDALIHNTLHQMDPNLTRIDLGAIGSQPEIWDLAEPAALEGVVFQHAIDPSNPRTVELAEILKVSPDELSTYTAQGFDAIHILAQAIEAAGSVDAEAVNDAMQEIVDYAPHYGAEDFRLSFSSGKHLGPDSICGLVLREFGSNNRPSGLWEDYKPAC